MRSALQRTMRFAPATDGVGEDSVAAARRTSRHLACVVRHPSCFQALPKADPNVTAVVAVRARTGEGDGAAARISRTISDLFPAVAELVRVLRVHGGEMRSRDFRTICDCQRHRARRRFWSLSLSAAGSASQQLVRGGVALIVGVPLAFGAVNFPMDPVSGHALTPRVEAMAETFHVFTTRKIRREFLTHAAPQMAFTSEMAKEQFFHTAIPFGSIIYREARRNELPPELVAAVVGAESDFRVTLVSEKDAQGLMQVLPSTGKLLGARDLLDPEENIVVGTKYLRYLVDRFHDPRIALAAYNAGEGNVEKWGGIPPFPETIAYLDRVNKRARLYRGRIRDSYLSGLRTRAAAN